MNKGTTMNKEQKIANAATVIKLSKMKTIIDKFYNQPLRRIFSRVTDGYPSWLGPHWLLNHLASVQLWILKEQQ